jgi:hypothetical protein
MDRLEQAMKNLGNFWLRMEIADIIRQQKKFARLYRLPCDL